MTDDGIETYQIDPTSTDSPPTSIRTNDVQGTLEGDGIQFNAIEFAQNLGFGGFAQAGKYIHIMHATGMAMIVMFVYVFLAPYRRLNKALALPDLAAAGEQLAQIRRLIGINLTLGLVTTIIGTSGAYWLN